jgi:hypothetical protein
MEFAYDHGQQLAQRQAARQPGVERLRVLRAEVLRQSGQPRGQFRANPPRLATRRQGLVW